MSMAGAIRPGVAVEGFEWISPKRSVTLIGLKRSGPGAAQTGRLMLAQFRIPSSLFKMALR